MGRRTPCAWTNSVAWPDSEQNGIATAQRRTPMVPKLALRSMRRDVMESLMFSACAEWLSVRAQPSTAAFFSSCLAADRRCAVFMRCRLRVDSVSSSSLSSLLSPAAGGRGGEGVASVREVFPIEVY